MGSPPRKHLSCFIWIATAPNMSMGEVTDALQFTASTTTSIADRLVERELIERGINPEDRRVVVASLTSKGQDLVDQIKARRARSFSALLDSLSDAEIDAFKHTVEVIVTAMESEAAQ